MNEYFGSGCEWSANSFFVSFAWSYKFVVSRGPTSLARIEGWTLFLPFMLLLPVRCSGLCPPGICLPLLFMTLLSNNIPELRRPFAVDATIKPKNHS